MDSKRHIILNLIREGESISLEFKECRTRLSRDVYETVCAFLNRHGGTLLLGVNDRGEVIGIDPELVEGDIFRIVIPVTQDGVTTSEEINKSGPESRLESEPELRPESLERRVLEVLIGHRLSKIELARALGHTSVSGALNQVVRNLLLKNEIEFTMPEKPRSRMQKYRLTEKGRQVMRTMQKTNLQTPPQVTPQVKSMLKIITRDMSRKEIQDKLGLKDRSSLFENYLNPGLEAGLIEKTQPNSPNSPTQKYRLTAKGHQFISRIEENDNL